jgi:general stress protein 26
MDEQEAKTESLKLVDNAAVCLLGSNGEDGFPYIKAVLNLRHEGFKTFWFDTNTSSKRVRQLKKDSRASLYFVDEINFKGLMLLGTAEVLRDLASRRLLWTKDSEFYYPLGIDDPDYTVLRFTATLGNYYHGLKNIDFTVI